jgi:hypothetical protein
LDQLPEQAQTNRYLKNGHKGLLTVKHDSLINKDTTYTDDYINKSTYNMNGEVKGARYKLTEKILTEKLMEEFGNDETTNDYLDEPTSYISEAHEKYMVHGFVHEPIKPTGVI